MDLYLPPAPLCISSTTGQKEVFRRRKNHFQNHKRENRFWETLRISIPEDITPEDIHPCQRWLTCPLDEETHCGSIIVALWVHHCGLPRCTNAVQSIRRPNETNYKVWLLSFFLHQGRFVESDGSSKPKDWALRIKLSSQKGFRVYCTNIKPKTGAISNCIYLSSSRLGAVTTR